MGINKILIFLFFLGFAASCDLVNKEKGCCYDAECTGSNCQKGCGMVCCGNLAKTNYQKNCQSLLKMACTASVKLIITTTIKSLSCKVIVGSLFYTPCSLVTAPTMVFGQYVCMAAGLYLFKKCDDLITNVVSPITETVCEYIQEKPICDYSYNAYDSLKRKISNLRLLSHSSEVLLRRNRLLSENSTLPSLSFPENYSMELISDIDNTSITTTIIKTKNEKGETVVFYKSRLNDSDETVYFFNYNLAGKTLNLTAADCSSNRGTLEPLDADFLDYFKAKLNIEKPFEFSSVITFENRRANLWIVKEILNDTKFVELHYLEDDNLKTPLEIQLYLNTDLFFKIKVQNFSKEAKIDYNNDHFKKCDVCSNITSCEQIKDFPQCGWCPSENRAFKIDPVNGQVEFPKECNSNTEFGQWTTSWEDLPDNREGQWTFYTIDCICLTATSFQEIQGKTYNCGWCPSKNKGFVGDSKSPTLNATCPASADKGQWTYYTKNYKCLTAKTCQDIENTDCGWCPSLKRAFFGDENGPNDGIQCPTTDEGQWTLYTKDCICLTATTLQEIQGNTYNCGWCPSKNKGFVGGPKAPTLNATCPASAEKGQWTYYTKNYKCLTAETCQDIENTDCGWCPSLKKAFLGDENGPYDGIQCPTANEGQWIINSKDCICLTATTLQEIQGKTYNCGWCPSKNKGFVGDSKGPTLNETCPASADKGQWTYYTKNYKCLTAKTCQDIENTDCGWCPSLKRAFFGDENGPYDGIQCPTTEEGQWIINSKDCICLTATSFEEIAKTSSCGWCPSKNKGFIGNSKGPTLNETCPASADKGQWTYYTKNYKCLTAKTCQDIENTDCGWCPSLKRAFFGDENGPYDSIQCPTTEEGQWIINSKDCICLTATSFEEIGKTSSCGWCPSKNKGFIGNSKAPTLNATCPASAEKGQWTYYTNNYKCLTAQTCQDIQNTDCGWCPSLKRAFFGDVNGPFDGIQCPSTIQGQWTMFIRDCECPTVKTCQEISNKLNCGWCTVDNKSFIGTSLGPSYGLNCTGKWVWNSRDCLDQILE